MTPRPRLLAPDVAEPLIYHRPGMKRLVQVLEPVVIDSTKSGCFDRCDVWPSIRTSSGIGAAAIDEAVTSIILLTEIPA